MIAVQLLWILYAIQAKGTHIRLIPILNRIEQRWMIAVLTGVVAPQTRVRRIEALLYHYARSILYVKSSKCYVFQCIVYVAIV